MSYTPLVRFAYADPPFLGSAHHYLAYDPQALDYNTPQAHHTLIARLQSYDGWALSLSAPSLHTILPLVPPTARVAAWVKPFAPYRKNVRVAYTWEPVIFAGGRPTTPDPLVPVTRDHLAESSTVRQGLPGAKPRRFCVWVLAMLGWVPDDTVDDLFPGTAIMTQVTQESKIHGLDIPLLRARPGQDRGPASTPPLLPQPPQPPAPITCEVCHTSFTPRRVTRKTCSDACRQQKSRASRQKDNNVR